MNLQLHDGTLLDRNGDGRLDASELRSVVQMLNEKGDENNALREQLQHLEENALESQRLFHKNQQDLRHAMDMVGHARMQAEEAQRAYKAKAEEAARAVQDCGRAQLDVAAARREIALKQRSLDESQRDSAESASRHAQAAGELRRQLELRDAELHAARSQLDEARRAALGREAEARKSAGVAESARSEAATARAQLEQHGYAAKHWEEQHAAAQEGRAVAMREVEALQRQLAAARAEANALRNKPQDRSGPSLRVELATRSEHHLADLRDLGEALAEVRREAIAQREAGANAARGLAALRAAVRNASSSQLAAQEQSWRVGMGEGVMAAASRDAHRTQELKAARNDKQRSAHAFEELRAQKLMLEERTSELQHELQQMQHELQQMLQHKERETQLMQKQLATMQRQRDEAQRHYREMASGTAAALSTPAQTPLMEQGAPMRTAPTMQQKLGQQDQFEQGMPPPPPPPPPPPSNNQFVDM